MTNSLPDTLRLRRAKWVGYLILAIVLGLAFWGYSTPSMVLSWDNLMALCGFG